MRRSATPVDSIQILAEWQPVRDRYPAFDTDTLIDMLARLGVHVGFVVKASRRRLNVA